MTPRVREILRPAAPAASKASSSSASRVAPTPPVPLQSVPTPSGAGQFCPSQPAPSCLVVRWLVGRPAAARAQPGRVRPEPRVRPVVLEITVRADGAGGWSASAELLDGGARIQLPVPATRARLVGMDGLCHVEAPGVVRATLDAGGRVLWAQTPLLGELGITGGRSELAR